MIVPSLWNLALATTLCIATPVMAAHHEDLPPRLDEDIVRDARSRPDVTLPLLKLEPGDRVADIWGGGGYYSELIAGITGSDGEVLLINNAAYAQFAKPGLERRFTDREFANITIHTREADRLDLDDQSLDAALIILSYHDLYHVDEASGWNAIDAGDFLQQIANALKPKGRFLIVDHNAAPHSGKTSAQVLHRIDIEFAKADIERHGLRLVAESDVLRNPEDDYSVSVFDDAVRGQTDRFILVFEKL